jgi:hypothetical protein
MRNPISRLIKRMKRIDEIKALRDRYDFELELHRERCPSCHGLTHADLLIGIGCEVGTIIAMKVDIENINLKWAA